MDLHKLIETHPEKFENYSKCDKCDFICENAKVLGVHKRIHNTIDTAKVSGKKTIYYSQFIDSSYFPQNTEHTPKTNTFDTLKHSTLISL